MELLNAIILFGSLAALVYMFGFLFRKYHIDAFRQRIFAIRDELFDYAAAGNISFDDPAYKMLRNLMNGYIRFGHRLSLLHIFIVMGLMFRSRHSSDLKHFEHQFTYSLAALTPETRDALTMYRERAEMNVLYFLLVGSFLKKLFALPILFGMFLGFLINRGFKRLGDFRSYAFRQAKTAGQVRRSMEVANEDAYCEGLLVAQA